MSIYKPSELRLFLHELGIFPKRGLSQNFLIDGNVIRKILATAQVEPGDWILEIGPGPGSLTQALLDAGVHVIAVEKDAILAQALNRLQTSDNRLEVFCADILKFPIEDTFKARLKGKRAKVIANLPYHITTPILAKLVPLHDVFSSIIVMVQEEVARRFVALPGTKEYGSFTVFLKFYTNPSYVFSVSPRCFYPEPKVYSAVVKLDLKESFPLENSESFFNLTRTAFEHRRKMLRASLKDLFDSNRISAALEAIGQNPLARPETLSLEDFLNLHSILFK
jgi:16S rRNA (adenine1518-N6/adenine1519-N6)-dimethyltransferase